MPHTYTISKLLAISAPLLPSVTYPMSQLSSPSFCMSPIKPSTLFLGRATNSPPLVSAEQPSNSLYLVIPKVSNLCRCLITGSFSITNLTGSFCAWAKQVAWPKIPKPVTSVQAFDSYFLSNRAPTIFRVAIRSQASQKTYITWDSLTQESTLFFFSLSDFIHCIQLIASLVPKGFVRTSLSPGLALYGQRNWSSLTIPIAHPPSIGHMLNTLCPPPTRVLAWIAVSVNPSIIRVVATSLSFSLIYVDTPRIMSTSAISSIPIAQRSDSTLQSAILPNMQGDSLRGQKKSSVVVTVQGPIGQVETSGVQLPISLGIFLRQERSLSWGILHPHPFILVQLVSTNDGDKPCATGSNGGILGGFPLENHRAITRLVNIESIQLRQNDTQRLKSRPYNLDIQKANGSRVATTLMDSNLIYSKRQ